MKLFIITTTMAVTLLLSVGAAANQPTSDKKGLEIAKALDTQDNGFVDQTAKMKMILRDRLGKESSRDILSKTLEVKNDGDKTLVTFLTPRTVKDTKFLSWTHKTADDDQWLFLPKLKRVKRIASNNKSGPFMGSEFAYEDISSQEIEKYTYKYHGEETLNNIKCDVIDRFPTDKKSGYSRQRVWITQGASDLRVLKIEFYDVKKAHLKTLSMEGYKKYAEKYWRPEVMKMVNHVTGKSTDLVWSDYKFKSGLTSRDFDTNALKRK